MANVTFYLADGEDIVAPKTGKWTADELRSHIGNANIGGHYTDMEEEELVVLDQNRNVVVRADEEATEQILEDLKRKTIKIISRKMPDFKGLEINVWSRYISFIWHNIEISVSLVNPVMNHIHRNDDYSIDMLDLETIYNFLGHEITTGELYGLYNLQ